MNFTQQIDVVIIEQLINLLMKTVRKLKSIKPICIKTQQQIAGSSLKLTSDPEEIAKKDLIELSHTDYFAKQDNQFGNQQNFSHNLNSKLQAESSKQQNIKISRINLRYDTKDKESLYKNENQRLELLNQFKRLTEGLQQISKSRRLSVNSERNYNYNYKLDDNQINITLQNPISVSNYLVSGSNRNKMNNTFFNVPQGSQYVIRQQRNASKIKKSKSKCQSYGKSRSVEISDFRSINRNAMHFRYFNNEITKQNSKIRNVLKTGLENLK